jgi:hypothetical protein
MVFARKKAANSERQRAILGSAVLGDLALTGKQAQAVHEKQMWQESSMRQAKEGFLSLLEREEFLDKEAVLDPNYGKGVAEFYAGSGTHLPPLPPVDVKVKEGKAPRTVVRKVVEGSLEVVDHPEGIDSNYFVLIRGDKEKAGSRRRAQECKAFEIMEKAKRGSDCRNDPGGARIAVLDGKGSCYMNFGTNGNTCGGGMKTQTERLEKDPHALRIFSRWVRSVGHRVNNYLPLHARSVFNLMREECEGSSMPLADGKEGKQHSALVAGRNVSLNVHTDKDFVWSLTCAVPEVKKGGTSGDAIICYFCFPTLNLAVPLREGDVLLFNALVPHCVSSRCDPCREAYCVSMYTGANLPGGNSNRVDEGGKTLSSSKAELSEAVRKQVQKQKEGTKKRGVKK